MQKVFVDVGRLDRRCYQEFELSEDLLMEHAAMAMASHITDHFSANSKILVVAGPGNNGADGIALARLLAQRYRIELRLPLAAKSKMARQQLARINKLAISVDNELNDIDVVVDCLFGSGLTRPLNDTAIALIEQLNRLSCYKIACDIPSGINSLGQPAPIAFKSDVTITMGALKTALFSDSAKDYVGMIRVADLGLPRTIYQTETDCYLLEAGDLKLPRRERANSHKGSYGHLAVIVGEKPGAGILTSLAAFNFGCGLVSAITDPTADTIFDPQVRLPLHIMCSAKLLDNTSAIAIGMGLGRDYWQHSPHRLAQLMQIKKPKLIDADLCYWPDLVQYLDRGLIITPHPKEFCSLLKLTKLADITVAELQQDRFKYLRLFSAQYPALVLLLKGCNTLIAQDNKIYINNLGSAILSKGGSGDVLAGFIAALLAQGYPPLDAAISGSIAHVLAGERCQSRLAINNYAMIPQDLIEQVRYL